MDFGNAFFYVAFNDLASCRLFENGHIPWTALRDYANEYQVTEADQRDILFEVIRAMDVWYLDRMASKAAKDGKTGHKPVGGKADK